MPDFIYTQKYTVNDPPSNLTNLQTDNFYASTTVGVGTTNATSALTVSGNVLVSGAVTATKFVGDGGGLIGLAGIGSGVIVRNNGTLIGVAQTINFANNLSVTPISVGIVTVNLLSSLSGGITVAGVVTATTFLGQINNITGVSTISTLAVNVSSASTSYINTGIITTISGTNLNYTGVSTFTAAGGPVLVGGATSTGTSTQVLQVSGISSDVYIGGKLGLGNTNPTSKLDMIGDANITGQVTANRFFGDGSGLTGITATGSGVVLKDDNTTVGTAATINFGSNLSVTPVSSGIATVNVTGIITATGMSVSGVVTATSFVGDGTGLTNIFLGLNGKFYSTPGTFTIGTDCPSAITQIKIIACGGGGSGASAPPGPGNAGGGGGAATANIFYRSVSNGQVYTITIGGAAGSTTIAYPGPTVLYTCTAGGNGGVTGGGSGGAKSPLTPFAYLGGGGGGGGSGYQVNPSGNASPYQAGGNGGNGGVNFGLSILSGYSYGGTGGSGNGGGGPGSPAGPTPSSAYGAGGGGGGGGQGDGGSGTSGAPGACWIEW
jgi:hypothetical protein